MGLDTLREEAQDSSSKAIVSIEHDEFEFDEGCRGESSADDIATAILDAIHRGKDNMEHYEPSHADTWCTPRIDEAKCTSDLSPGDDDRWDVDTMSRGSLKQVQDMYSGSNDLVVQEKESCSVLERQTFTESMKETFTIVEGDEEEEDIDGAEDVENGQAVNKKDDVVWVQEHPEIEESELYSKTTNVQEWVNLETSVVSNKTEATPVKTSSDKFCKMLNYNEVEIVMKSKDLSAFESAVIVSDRSRISFLSLHRSIGYEGSAQDLKFPFLLAQMDFDKSEPFHVQILTTIFKALRGESVSCPLVGSHWEQIGFQGIDPCTDLNRSMKMFALLQIMHFIEFDPVLAQEIYQSSICNDGTGSKIDTTWPFMVISITFTKEAIQALRSGCLNRKCNKRKSVLSVVHEYHHACFGRFYFLLTGTKDHFATCLSTIRAEIDSKPLEVLKWFKSMKSKGRLGLCSL